LLALPYIGYWTVALVYLLAVTIAGSVLWRGPILVLATLSALAWDLLFIPPRFTLHIGRTEDWVMFGTFFVVALVIGQLTTRMRERERAESEREKRAITLYHISRALAASTSLDQALRAALAEIGVEAAVLLSGPNGLDRHAANTLAVSEKEESVAAWSFQNRQPAGRSTDTLPESEALHLPLLTGDRAEGVPPSDCPLHQRSPSELLEACAVQLAIAWANSVRSAPRARLGRARFGEAQKDAARQREPRTQNASRRDPRRARTAKPESHEFAPRSRLRRVVEELLGRGAHRKRPGAAAARMVRRARSARRRPSPRRSGSRKRW
jgi:K+-sensing histidine kinase KdpD